MAFNLDDGMGAFFNSPSVAKYTTAQIDEAKKRQKKYGGTFLDNLDIILNGEPEEKEKGSVVSKSAKKPSTPSDISSMIKELNADIASDYDLPAAVAKDNGTMLDAFNGITEVLKEKIHGQDDYLRKLVISFKRPYVSERDSNDALNSIYITGKECTGKHYSLGVLVTELYKRGVLGSNEIHTMDLSIYPSAGEEGLFLQDLYSALQSKSTVIAFENYENCHVSILSRVSDLVITGECKLSERYVMKNGQLVSVSNSLAGNTIGALEAAGKYFVFISEKSVDKLAGAMGAPFVNALGDICATKELDEEALKTISGEQEQDLVNKCRKQLAYNVTVTDEYREAILLRSGRGKGLKGILDAYSDTLKALSELRLERDDLGKDMTLTSEDGSLIIKAGDENISVSSLLPSDYSGELEQIREELDKIVGLTKIKEYIYSLEEYYGVQKKRSEAGLKAGEVNKHMIFTGNPGTGKTTIARIVSKYLKAIGVLTGGQLVEVSRADLVGRYAGHTAPLVNQVIKSALGGVLFIDEAYSLNHGNDDSFGLEAIDTLVKGIEDNRDNLIVILAGYSNEMEGFLETNSGLKSRFPNIIDFPDYTGEELLKIADITASSKGYVIDESAKDSLLTYFNFVQATRAMDAGNGRLVRNKIEEAILNQSRRLVAEPEEDMSLLKIADFDLDK